MTVKCFLRPLFFVLLLESSVGASLLFSQEKRDSPVFKDYVPPGSPLLMTRSDATYRLWQTLMLTRKANAGDPVAQHELGVRYLTGNEIVADTVQGAYWVGKAAGQNYLPARFNLGILYYYGWGMSWDPFKAYKEFVHCAEKGMVEADYVLGQFYLDDLVVPRDEKEAYRRVKKAADSGYEQARSVLAKLQRSLDRAAEGDSLRPGSDEVAQADSLFGPVFLEFGSDSLNRDEDRALLNAVLGELEGGDGKADTGSTSMDHTNIGKVERLAEAGSPEALTLLGRLHEKGEMVNRDDVLAASYYLRAVRLGSGRSYELLWDVAQRAGFFSQLKSRSAREDAEAQFVWAGLHAFGMDMLTDVRGRLTDDQALRLFEKSARQGYLPAVNELGLCYFSGRWVQQSRAQAVEFWQESASSGSSEGKVRIAMITIREPADRAELSESIRVLQAASDSGSVLADVALGYCYEMGTGVAVSKGKAAWLYRKGASRGSRDAHLALMRMHDEIRPDDPGFSVDSQVP